MHVKCSDLSSLLCSFVLPLSTKFGCFSFVCLCESGEDASLHLYEDCVSPRLRVYVSLCVLVRLHTNVLPSSPPLQKKKSVLLILASLGCLSSTVQNAACAEFDTRTESFLCAMTL